MSFLQSQFHRDRTFVHCEPSLGYHDLETTTVNGKRQYVTPDGYTFPSITTVLGHGKNMAIEAWKKRIGEKEANRITNAACLRGTSLHLLAERYIANAEEVYDHTEMPDAMAMFRALVPEINKHVGRIFLQEKALYSNHLRVAGRTDLIAEFDGRLSVIDIKSSSRVKSRRDIKNYFMQEAAYAIMFEERTKIPVDRLVTLMAVYGQKEPIVFVEKRDDWTAELIKLIHEYEKTFGKPARCS